MESFAVFFCGEATSEDYVPERRAHSEACVLAAIVVLVVILL